jgi:hypothetical protein
MGLYPVPDLDGLARQYGVGLLTLGFLQATPSGQLGWAGLGWMRSASAATTNKPAPSGRRLKRCGPAAAM